MAVGAGSRRLPVRHVAEREQPLGGLGFDWAMIAVSSWLMAGIFLDAWAHTHLLSTLETFFTPWHGVLYSGFFAVSVFLLYALYRNRSRGYELGEAIPRGYGPALAGMLIFGAGGVGDMIWHMLFGIEANIEAALSPTHLLLGLGCVLLVSAPFRAAWYRPERDRVGLLAFLPVVISLAFALSIMNLLTEWVHPFAVLYAATGGGRVSEMLGVASILVQSAMLMGWVLLTVRRWTPPIGAFTIFFGVNAAFVAVLEDHWFLVPVALLAGLAADLLANTLRPSSDRTPALRIFAFAVAALYILFYFIALMLMREVIWTVHLWAGSVVLAGLVGLALSYLLVPPALPEAG